MGALFARFWCTCGPLQKNLMVSNFEADAIFNMILRMGWSAFQPHVKEKPGFWYRIFLIYDCKKRKEKKRERNKKKMN